MNLRNRAAGAVAIAMSVVVMTSVAQAAPAEYRTGVAAQTDGFFDIAARVSEQYDMLVKELTE